ncbi:PcfJ domain-containing protein [Pedobacter antarcticus]|uniref:PcfJ domain-containing protein n=1 Tax=Pedobacter antarcticus TaxID=34086 RepID=UPI00292DACC4|nr:PcfJ domain-containing protein [Pedobacter antarcticus]
MKSIKCPNCLVKIEIENSLKRKLDQYAVVASVDNFDGLQVNRFFEIRSYHNSGVAPKYSIREIVQQWFEREGKLTIVARSDSFGNGSFTGAMEIRANISNYWQSNKYDVYADKILPNANPLPIYARNGFNSKIEKVRLYSFLQSLLRDDKLETLIKAGQYPLALAKLGDRSNAIYSFWDSIKICMRRNYLVKDAVSYLDYLELLRHYGKDLHSPKYVCPANFKKEHNGIVKKRARDQRIERIIRDQQEAEKRKLQAVQENISYLEEKSPFFGLSFSEGSLTVKVLESVQEFISEGDYHKHCVYTNRYYSRPDSLCFSAKVDDLPVETVEVSLTEMKVIQSRGLHNHASEYNQQIIALIKKNMGQIRKRYQGLKKEAA